MLRFVLIFLSVNYLPSILGSPESDAKDLNEALNGIPNGYNESVLITVLYEKTYEQRYKMIEVFRKTYGEEAYNQLWNKISYPPTELRRGIMDNSSAYYDAKMLFLAMGFLYYDEHVLFEIMVTRTSQEMREIKKAYDIINKDGMDLCGDIETVTSGDLEDILLALCEADRDESDRVDEKLALRDCCLIYEYGPTYIFGTDEEGINSILFKRNYKQLQLMFEIFSEYRMHARLATLETRTIETVISSEYSYEEEDILQMYIKAVKNRAGYFADLIREGLTDGAKGERRVIRTIFSRAGNDLPEIVKEFGGKDKLVESITNSTDLLGFTKQALIAILNANCEKC